MGDIRRIRVCMFYLCFTRLNGCLHGGYYMDTCMHVRYVFVLRAYKWLYMHVMYSFYTSIQMAV